MLAGRYLFPDLGGFVNNAIRIFSGMLIACIYVRIVVPHLLDYVNLSPLICHFYIEATAL
mgnify:FL=1